MQRWMGVDINGWRDWSARDWDAEDVDEQLAEPALVDGGAGSVAIRNRSGRWIGGPQALLAPHGRGRGWGDLGHADNRRTMAALWRDLIANGRDAAPGFAAAVDALTRGAERIMLTVPDHPGFAEAAQGRVLRVLKGPKRPRSLLLWRSVALFLHALSDGTIPRDRVGLRVRLLIHAEEGIEVQTLRLAEADGFPRHLAPERDGFGVLLHPELGLARSFDIADRIVLRRNSVISEGRIETSRLPVRLLCESVQAGEVEILRRDNGTWAEVFAPDYDGAALVPEAAAGAALGEADLTFVASPLAPPPRAALLACLESHFPGLQALPWEGIALGALRAGRLFEKGLPHYLDRLEPISLAVLGRDEASFVPLIPRGSNVPANREFVSEPMPGFFWDADKKKIEFYVLKGEREVRSWIATKEVGPEKNVAVILQLRQMPGQSWAKLSVSSSEWEPLARAPINLDWDALDPDPRSPEEILETLKRPRPIVPVRVVEHPHIRFWDGTLIEPGLTAMMGGDSGQLYKGLRRTGRDIADFGSHRGSRQTFRPVGTDGTLPEQLSAAERQQLLEELKRLEEEFSGYLEAGQISSSNRGFLCLTWCFTLCPEPVQNAMLDALEAWNADQPHPLLAMQMAQTILQQGAGRATNSPIRVARLLSILEARTPQNMHTRAAMSFVLSRRKEAPEALTDDLARRIAEKLLAHLQELANGRSFEQDFKYVLMAVTGLLRYREVSPWALVADREPAAREFAVALAEARKRLAQRVRSVTQGQAKLAIVDDLIEMLSGTGGDPDLLRRIDDLSE